MIKKGFLALSLALSSAFVASQPAAEYEVRITNITPGQTFTPQLVVTHSADYFLFRLGEPASEALAMLAEGGDTAPVIEEIGSRVMDATTIDGLLAPGATSTVVVTGHPGRGFLTVAAMLIPTNDTFVALNRIRLPNKGGAMYLVPAYDAGTELNDQNCLNIPGPRCGGSGYSEADPETDEGFVHIGNGFHEIAPQGAGGADILGPQVYDWRNSVARVTVRRR